MVKRKHTLMIRASTALEMSPACKVFSLAIRVNASMIILELIVSSVSLLVNTRTGPLEWAKSCCGVWYIVPKKKLRKLVDYRG